MAVDDPLVAVAARRASAAASGRSRRSPARSSRTPSAGRRRAADTATAPSAPGVPGHREDLGVAGVRRLVAEHRRRERRRAEDLVHEAELDLAEALAAELGRQVRRPQPALLDLLLAAARWRARSPPGRGPRRPSRSARSPRARTRASSRAAPGTRARSRSPTPSKTASSDSLGNRVAGMVRNFRTRGQGGLIPRRVRARGGRPRDRGRRRRARGRGAAVRDRLRLRAGLRAAGVRGRRARAGGLAADRARADRQPHDPRHRAAPAAAAGARLA